MYNLNQIGIAKFEESPKGTQKIKKKKFAQRMEIFLSKD